MAQLCENKLRIVFHRFRLPYFVKFPQARAQLANSTLFFGCAAKRLLASVWAVQGVRASAIKEISKKDARF